MDEALQRLWAIDSHDFTSHYKWWFIHPKMIREKMRIVEFGSFLKPPKIDEHSIAQSKHRGPTWLYFGVFYWPATSAVQVLQEKEVEGGFLNTAHAMFLFGFSKLLRWWCMFPLNRERESCHHSRRHYDLCLASISWLKVCECVCQFWISQ